MNIHGMHQDCIEDQLAAFYFARQARADHAKATQLPQFTRNRRVLLKEATLHQEKAAHVASCARNMLLDILHAQRAAR